jgi:TPR repeat protein
MWMFGLGWLALVLVAGAFHFTLSAERASVSTAPPPAVAAQAAAPQAIAPPAPAVVAAAAAAQTDDDLVPSGIGFMRTGDIATARLYFERAAEAGNAHAALLVGETYDGPLLSKLGVRGMRGDPQEATRWYERARDLGDADAAERLVGIAGVK